MQRSTPRFYSHQDARNTAAIFAIAIALSFTFNYWFVRMGLSTPILPLLETLSISIFLLLFPQGLLLFCHLFYHRFAPREDSLLSSEAFLSLIGLGGLVLAGIATPVLDLNLLPIFAIPGFLLCLHSFYIFLSRDRIISSLIFLITAFVFSLYTVGVVWGSFYLSPLYRENLISGTTSIDTLFHGSLMGMIATYGVPSTGLDGLAYLPYHYGSHWIFAQLSNLLQLEPLEFYNLAFPIIFIPFFFKAAFILILEIKSAWNSSNQSPILRRDFLFWLVFFIGFVGFIPATWNNDLGTVISLASFLPSESHVLGLSFCFLTLSIGLCSYRRLRNPGQPMGTLELLGLSILLTLLVAMTSLLKISLGFLLFCLGAYLFLRLKLYSLIVLRLFALLLLTSFSAIFWINASGDSAVAFSSYFSLFAYLRDWVKYPAEFLWFYLLLFWSLIYIVLRLWHQRIATLGELKQAFLQKQLIDLEIVVVLSLVGLAPGMLLALPAADAGYFMDLQSWVSLCFLLGGLAQFSKSNLYV
jgi:hypothetical protein